MTSFRAKTDLFQAVYSERMADMDPVTYDSAMNPASYAMEVRAHMEKTVVRKVGEQVIASIAANNGVWVPSSSVWYKRAAGIFYAAKRAGVPVGFPSAAAMASYVVSIAPESCPVFGVKFVERGAGFSKWSPSIDKIDPKLGYVTGNIQVISMLANCMKRDATREQLYMFAEWVMKGEHHGRSSY